MARIDELNPIASISGTDVIIVDDGVETQRGTIAQVTAGLTYASEAQARAGTATNVVMNPLQTANAIDEFASVTAAGDNTFTGSNAFNGALTLNGLQSETLAATANDLALNSTSNRLEITLTGDQTLNGLTGGANGRVVVVRNVDASEILTLSHDNVGSTAANRFALPSDQAFSVFPGQAVVLQYASSRWRLISQTFATGAASGNLVTVNQAVTTTASASTVTLGTTLEHSITGTTTITAFNGVAGVRYSCRAAAAFTLTHNASSLILPTDANITTAAGDTFEVYMLTASTCYVTNYQRKSGSALLPRSAYFETGSVSTGTTVIPLDDTIPQNTEGDEYMTLAYAPTSATSILEIDVVWVGASSVNSQLSVALFKDSDTDAIAASSSAISDINSMETIPLRHRMVAGTTSEIDFKVRAGINVSGTTTFNGRNGARLLGGVMASSIKITEYPA